MECIECGRIGEGRAPGWRGFRADEDEGSPAELVFYCPTCAAHEFGPFAADFELTE